MNTDKYIALAFASPRGLKLRTRVERAWPQWLQQVENARWLRNFKGSPLLRKKSRARTPDGAFVPKWPLYKHHAVADAIYATAVWGFGVEGRSENDPYWEQQAKDFSVVNSVGIYGLNKTRVDGHLPEMFRDLDRWLDTLWV